MILLAQLSPREGETNSLSDGVTEPSETAVNGRALLARRRGSGKRRRWWIPDPPRGGNPSPVADPANDECCVRTFLYPVPIPAYSFKQTGQMSFDAFWVFFVLMVFLNYDDKGRQCRCRCCKFSQEIEGYNELRGAKERKKGEDCQQGHCYGQDPIPERLRFVRERLLDTFSYELYQVFSAEEVTGGLLGALLGLSGSACVRILRDRPGLSGIPAGAQFAKDMCYTGRVRDTCVNDTTRAKDNFRVVVEGRVVFKGGQFVPQYSRNPEVKKC
jgi:hypothetical protein